MIIIDDDRLNSGWITAVINDRWVQAKVYDEPSMHGVNCGRVSKLCIGKDSSRDPLKSFFEQMAYNYDRGLDFDELPDGVLESILGELEELPEVCS